MRAVLSVPAPRSATANALVFPPLDIGLSLLPFCRSSGVEQPALASTPPGMPGTHPLQYFVGGDVNGNIPTNIITYVWIYVAKF